MVGCEVTWGGLLWLVATWHVMSCHLMWWSRHLIRCDFLCCVMSRDATRCHGHELFSVFLTTKYSSVLQSTTRTTLYYKVQSSTTLYY